MINENTQTVLQSGGLAVYVGWLVGILPTIATALTVIALAISIYESKTTKKAIDWIRSKWVRS